MKKYLGFMCVLLSFTALGQHTFTSELNGKILYDDSVKLPYKVVFGGHLYGNQNDSIEPYGTFAKAFNKINLEKGILFFSLGDAVRRPNFQQYTKFANIVERIDAPVFPVIGNHEWMDSRITQINLGFPYYIVEAQGSAFIILNAEDWENKEQKQFFDKQLKDYIKSPRIQNIFILTHKLIWAVGNPAFADLVNLTNSPEMHQGAPMVDLAMLKTHTTKNFFFVSGDLGLNPKMPFFMEKEGNITYVATGIGDLPTDALITATIGKDGVTFAPLYLGSDESAKLNEYNNAKIAQLNRKIETIKAAVKLNDNSLSKAMVVGLTVLVFGLGFWLLFGKNEI